MMEQLQKPTETVEMIDSERGIKRNITTITTPNRNTENAQFKSPARKEMRFLKEETSYEQQLAKEMEDWKSLIRADKTQMEEGFIMSDLIGNMPTNFMDILDSKQKNYLSNFANLTKMTKESGQFRRNLGYLSHLNQTLMDRIASSQKDRLQSNHLKALEHYANNMQCSNFIALTDIDENEKEEWKLCHE